MIILVFFAPSGASAQSIILAPPAMDPTERTESVGLKQD
jgi:hypothetical protein